jgi:hypothetical protein
MSRVEPLAVAYATKTDIVESFLKCVILVFARSRSSTIVAIYFAIFQREIVIGLVDRRCKAHRWEETEVGYYILHRHYNSVSASAGPVSVKTISRHRDQHPGQYLHVMPPSV